MNMPILIVDDYNAMLKIIQTLLKQLGFGNVWEATDGGAAQQKIRDKNYGLVISDFYTEPMSSLQLLTEIRIDAELTRVSPRLIAIEGSIP